MSIAVSQRLYPRLFPKTKTTFFTFRTLEDFNAAKLRASVEWDWDSDNRAAKCIDTDNSDPDNYFLIAEVEPPYIFIVLGKYVPNPNNYHYWGIDFRAPDDSWFYHLWTYGITTLVRVYDGSTFVISGNCPDDYNNHDWMWIAVKVEADGSINIFINNEFCISGSLPNLTNKHQIGFHTWRTPALYREALLVKL